ncbi:hypothetical protein SAMN05444273_10476 [Litoreibacter ascidiaceicola]|uniref:Uncharacterized protein n=2 Tax=Litoreibacter ascidiaceicola TaxID=1486859 RepID=A0A1M4Z7P5_9RHOB|nr:hypothetical protein SAMN05444273_10476 [Litoreibacter ascidiaceicola]
MKKFLLPFLLLSACGDIGPAVPSQAGMNLVDARQAFHSCLPNAPRAGQNAVVGSYVSSVVFGGILLGPIGVAINEDQIRYHGEASGVDRCLRKRGFKRRVLTKQEVATINSSPPTTRALLLNHFVAGGTLENFSAPKEA